MFKNWGDTKFGHAKDCQIGGFTVPHFVFILWPPDASNIETRKRSLLIPLSYHNKACKKQLLNVMATNNSNVIKSYRNTS